MNSSIIKSWTNLLSSGDAKRKHELLSGGSTSNSVGPAVVELWDGIGSSSSNRSPTTTATRLLVLHSHTYIRILSLSIASVFHVLVFAHAIGLFDSVSVGLLKCHSAAAKTFSSTKKPQCLHVAAG